MQRGVGALGIACGAFSRKVQTKRAGGSPLYLAAPCSDAGLRKCPGALVSKKEEFGNDNSEGLGTQRQYTHSVVGQTMTRHLDLGCGATPRNPYGRDELFGVDLVAREHAGATVKGANLSVQAIPFESNSFDSVSAYDFLEHVPRVLPTPDGLGTRFPFIELMNEVWRVLIPGGLFYAVTPAFPSKAAFQDPTHVNIITESTHVYFTQPQRMAAMYGFVGNFGLVRSHWIKSRAGVHFVPHQSGLGFRTQVAYRAWRAQSGSTSHLLWEFQAIKP